MKQKPKLKQQKGFAVMSKQKGIKIARMGGQAVSKNRKHMAKIGAIGGAAKVKTKKR